MLDPGSRAGVINLPSRFFINLTQPEIASQLNRNPLVILPAGSVEQHGPHLPAGTDIFAADVIAEAVAERMDGIVLPGGPLGVTPLHMAYEGTLSLSHDTYTRVVKETAASAAQHGAKQLLILNWHEGNIPALAIAAESLHLDHGMAVLVVQACYVAAEMFGAICQGLTHGGEIEALAVLATKPNLVHLERVANSSDIDRGHEIDKLRRNNNYQPVIGDVRWIAPSGWYGQPQQATEERGLQMVSRLADSIAQEAREIFLRLDEVQVGVAELKRAKRVS